MSAAKILNRFEQGSGVKRIVAGSATLLALSVLLNQSATAATTVAAAAQDGDFDQVRELISAGAAVRAGAGSACDPQPARRVVGARASGAR